MRAALERTAARLGLADRARFLGWRGDLADLYAAADLLVGQVALGSDRRLRTRLSADYGRLEFLRVLRAQPHEDITDPGGLVAPPLPSPDVTEVSEAADG